MRTKSMILLSIAAISFFCGLKAGINIIEAKYGVLSAPSKTINITAKLQSQVNGKDQFSINSGNYNKLFGDPAKKTVKQLYVKYNDGKNIIEKTVSEKESITFTAVRKALPTQAKPATLPAEPTSGPIATIVNDYNDPQEIVLIKFETPGSQGRQDITAWINDTPVKDVLTKDSNINGPTETLQPGESKNRRYRVGPGGADNSGMLMAYFWIFKNKILRLRDFSQIRLGGANIKFYGKGSRTTQSMEIQK